jgi:hypothetical protein
MMLREIKGLMQLKARRERERVFLGLKERERGICN